MIMTRRVLRAFIIPIFLFTTAYFCSAKENKTINPSLADSTSPIPVYSNLFEELLGKTPGEVQGMIHTAFDLLFYGDSSNQRIVFPSGTDMTYIKDILNNDVRTEGMSYGMMIAVQLDRQKEFNQLWKWSKTYMQHQQGQRSGYFAWHCTSNGVVLDSNSASDGEEWFATALFFAAARWGNGEGIYNYKAEAQSVLDAMLTKADSSDSRNIVTNMFNKKEKQVVFVPSGEADDFTDPSYHVPHFYELWSRRADKENKFWKDAAATSRRFWKNAVHPVTGLAPDYAKFDGSPFSPWGGGNDHFQYDAWRVAMNVALDHMWFGGDHWAVEQSNRLLTFFYHQGIKTYGNLFTLDGKQRGSDHSSGLVAMNAAAALASTLDIRKEFVQELWNLPVPNGAGRYYDGMLYMLSLLQVSGQFKMYDPPRVCNSGFLPS
jgi:oligosaccharide reducing-end xylanase